MLYEFMLNLHYETTSDQLRYVLVKVCEMLFGHLYLLLSPIVGDAKLRKTTIMCEESHH